MELSVYWSIRIASVGFAILVSIYLSKIYTTRLERVTNNYNIRKKRQYAVFISIISAIAFIGYTLLYFVYDRPGTDKIVHAAIAVTCLGIITLMVYVLSKKKIGSF